MQTNITHIKREYLNNDPSSVLAAGISLKTTEIGLNIRKCKVIQGDNEELHGAKVMFDNKVREGEKKLYKLNKDAKVSMDKLTEAQRYLDVSEKYNQGEVKKTN